MDKQKARYDRARRFHRNNGSVTRAARRGLVFVIGAERTTTTSTGPLCTGLASTAEIHATDPRWNAS